MREKIKHSLFLVDLQIDIFAEIMLQKTKGIVLHTLKYNENSLIVEMYTSLHGRISFITNVPRSRKASVKTVLFQPLSLIELEADFKNKGKLVRIKEAKPYSPFISLPYDPYKSSIALFLAEFLYRAVREETENLPLFSYLEHSLIWLDECSTGFANFHLVFLMRLSRFLGLYPNLDHYFPGDYFDLQSGCFVSTPPQLHTSYINPEESARLQTLIRMNYDTMHLFEMNRQQRARVLSIIIDYYRLHVHDFPALKSLDILKELFD